MPRESALHVESVTLAPKLVSLGFSRRRQRSLASAPNRGHHTTVSLHPTSELRVGYNFREVDVVADDGSSPFGRSGR